MNPVELDFSAIEIREIPVVGPNKEHFVLREANGRAATDHRNAIMSSSEFGPDGKVIAIKDLASVEAKFIAACLWDDKGRNPSPSLIQSWPARVQKQLYEKVKELSDFGDESIVAEALKKALSREDSPITFSTLSEWAKSLPNEEFSSLKILFGSTDNSKNS